MKYTRSQQLMIKDGAPAALFISEAQRAKAWAGRPMTVIPAFNLVPRNEDEATAAFRAQVEAERRQKSLAQITRMKTRFATKAIDYTKMRWDPRKGKFVEDVATPAIPKPEERTLDGRPVFRPGVFKMKLPAIPVASGDYSRVTKDTARDLAELNGVWDAKYEKLSGGLLVMTVTNRLKGIVKRGGEVKWS